jgi:adenylate kinase family enzyme
VVVGTSAVGKTTLAAALSRRLGVPHIELDALYWGPGWTRADIGSTDDRTQAP